jgi:hypothetical protein
MADPCRECPRAGTARFIERAQISHNDNRYASIEDPYAFRGGIPAWQEAADVMLAWLGGVLSGSEPIR